MSDCIFCKINKNEIPSYTVYEDEFFKAILDIYPAAHGHVIVIPKEHAPDIFSLSDGTCEKVYPVLKKLAKAVKAALSCDGINILQNNGAAAWQSVSHFHVHIIPRYDNDNVKMPWATLKKTSEEFSDIAEGIKIALKN